MKKGYGLDRKYNTALHDPGKNRRLAFFMGFLRNPDLVGSIIPSSRFLERRLIEVADLQHARLVVELGPGTGGTTRAILAAMSENANLIALEINEEFVALLRAEADPRLIVHHGSAEHLPQILRHYTSRQPDVVISGIPFSTMPHNLGTRIIQAVWASLAPGGRFIAYQFRDQVAMLGRQLLGKPEIEVELLNIPPVRIFHWRKPLLR
ncbi:MAG: methyltransferase domain-containing protein [Pseudomonadota bacterium]